MNTVFVLTLSFIFSTSALAQKFPVSALLGYQSSRTIAELFHNDSKKKETNVERLQLQPELFESLFRVDCYFVLKSHRYRPSKDSSAYFECPLGYESSRNLGLLRVSLAQDTLSSIEGYDQHGTSFSFSGPASDVFWDILNQNSVELTDKQLMIASQQNGVHTFELQGKYQNDPLFLCSKSIQGKSHCELRFPEAEPEPMVVDLGDYAKDLVPVLLSDMGEQQVPDPKHILSSNCHFIGSRPGVNRFPVHDNQAHIQCEYRKLDGSISTLKYNLGNSVLHYGMINIRHQSVVMRGASATRLMRLLYRALLKQKSLPETFAPTAQFDRNLLKEDDLKAFSYDYVDMGYMLKQHELALRDEFNNPSLGNWSLRCRHSYSQKNYEKEFPSSFGGYRSDDVDCIFQSKRDYLGVR